MKSMQLSQPDLSNLGKEVQRQNMTNSFRADGFQTLQSKSKTIALPEGLKAVSSTTWAQKKKINKTKHISHYLKELLNIQ